MDDDEGAEANTTISSGGAGGGLTQRRPAASSAQPSHPPQPPAPPTTSLPAPPPQQPQRQRQQPQPQPPPGPGPGALAAAVAAARRRGEGPLPIGWLMEFSDPEVEAAYRSHAQAAVRAADTCNLVVNSLLVMSALLRHRVSHPWAGLLATPSLLACGASAAQSALLLLLLLSAPQAYARWRGAAVAAARLYRLGAWVLFTRKGLELGPVDDVTLRMLLFSPASSNIVFVLFYPLPLDLHIGLLALTSLVAVVRGAPAAPALLAAPELPPAAQAAYERLTRLARCAGGLVPRWMGQDECCAHGRGRWMP
jgi:hypothetical protein